jgi:hypothetical protein
MIVFRALFVASGQAPKLLPSIDEPLNASAQTVEGAIERPLVTFMLLARDRDPDTVLACILPSVSAAIPCIAHDPMGTALRAAWSAPLDGTGLQELCEDLRLVSLPRREDKGHQLAAPFSSPVDFGAETAPAPAEGFSLWGPFWAPAACWWARMMVPSIEWRSPCSWPAASACACTAAKS